MKSLLLGGFAYVKVVHSLEHANRAVDQLANDIGVAGVTLRVGRDVNDDVVQRDRLLSPPPRAPERIQGELGDRRV